MHVFELITRQLQPYLKTTPIQGHYFQQTTRSDFPRFRTRLLAIRLTYKHKSHALHRSLHVLSKPQKILKRDPAPFRGGAFSSHNQNRT